MLAKRCDKCGKSAYSCKCNGEKTPRFLFFYGGAKARSLIYYLKENADERTVHFIAEAMIRACGIKPNSLSGVTFVPRLRRKIRRAGYDQAKALAQAISKIYGIPLIPSLERVSRAKEQKLLSRSERKKEAALNFRPLLPLPNEKHKRLLLIDDVSTTGATIEACAKIIRESYAESVVPLVVSKTPFIK